MKHTHRTLIAVALAPLALLRGADFYVACGGSDANPGTASSPFASLERARDAVRSLRKAEAAPAGGVTVWIQPGVYERSRTLELGRADSGTATSPVLYRARAGGAARLCAGRAVRASDFAPVTQPAVLARLDAAARGKVVRLDLAARSLKNIGPFPPMFGSGGGLLELYVDDQRMPLSRWPNAGFVTMGKVLDRGDWSGGPARHGGTFVAREDRLARWSTESGVWLEGYWRVPWDPCVLQVQKIAPATREISFAVPINGGIGSKYAKRGELGDGKEPWCAVNVLEEIDAPGEWCVDFATRTLYFWPPGDLTRAQIRLADFDQPLVALRDVSHVTLRGLVLEGGLGNGVELAGGTSNLVAGCTFRNLGGSGVIVRGGQGHGVRSSDFHDLGGSGILLSGGDRKTLAPAGHFAENNHLHHLGIRKKTYAAAIHVGAYGIAEAVGCRVAHNCMHDLPHAAVLYGGNDHLFEFNEVARVALTSGDVGAFYTCNDWTSRGNVLRHNFVYDSPRANAFYLDDGDSGDTVEGNVVYRCSYGPFIGGGHDNVVRNNLVVECAKAYHLDSRGVARGYATNQNLVARLKAVGARQPPWSTRYPTLAGLLEGRRDLPTGDRIEENVAVDSQQLLHTSGKKEEFAFCAVSNNIALTAAEAGFADPARLDFRLRPDSAVFKALPGFKPIPFQQIGLVRNDDRTSLPDRGLSLAPRPGDGAAFDSNTDVQRTNRH